MKTWRKKYINFYFSGVCTRAEEIKAKCIVDKTSGAVGSVPVEGTIEMTEPVIVNFVLVKDTHTPRIPEFIYEQIVYIVVYIHSFV
jgi:hypothetical protein